jgi:hypothetical protein
MELKDLCDVAWNWGNRFPEVANVLDLRERVSDPAFSAEAQLIAATALAAAAPGPETYRILAKAAHYQPSVDWRAAFEDLRDLAVGTVEPEIQQP